MRSYWPRVGLVVLLAGSLAACGSSATATPTPNVADLIDAGLKAQRAGRNDEAAALYQRALVIDAKNKVANFDLGVIAQKQGKVTEADKYYRTALLTDPDFELALYNLGVLRTPLNSWEAVELYRHVIQI